MARQQTSSLRRHPLLWLLNRSSEVLKPLTRPAEKCGHLTSSVRIPAQPSTARAVAVTSGSSRDRAAARLASCPPGAGLVAPHQLSRSPPDQTTTAIMNRFPPLDERVPRRWDMLPRVRAANNRRRDDRPPYTRIPGYASRAARTRTRFSVRRRRSRQRTRRTRRADDADTSEGIVS